MKYELVYDLLIGLLSRSGGIRLNLYMALVGLEGHRGWFFKVMKWYKIMYVEWIMVGVNLSLYSNVVHDVFASTMFMICGEM